MPTSTFLVNNPSKIPITIPDLNATISLGPHNLFDLNPKLTFDLIYKSLNYGDLKNLIANRSLLLVYDFSNQYTGVNVIVRPTYTVQRFQSRVKFNVVEPPTKEIFTSAEDADLFEDEKIIPARELAEKLQNTAIEIEEIQATIKNANIQEKPFDSQYIRQSVVVKEQKNEVLKQDLERKLEAIEAPDFDSDTYQVKLKNDIKMGYQTCAGITTQGKTCSRRAVKGDFCGLHKPRKKSK